MNLALLLAVAARLLHDSARTVARVGIRAGRCQECGQSYSHREGCDTGRIIAESAAAADQLDRLIESGTIHRVSLISADRHGTRYDTRE